jgi:cupin fold WbuC family metalloprotein
MIKINQNFLQEVSLQAKASPRKRMNYNYHTTYENGFQRFLNAMEPGSYIRPHKHENPDRAEAFIAIHGKMLVIVFNNDGSIKSHCIISPGGENVGVEIPARTFHTVLSLEENSVAYEAKEGPYIPKNEINSAAWSPPEGTPEVESYLKRLLQQLRLA